jgi:hypothetical protein
MKLEKLEMAQLIEIIWSGREDLNLRLPAPKAGALPGCATPRSAENSLTCLIHCGKHQILNCTKKAEPDLTGKNNLSRKHERKEMIKFRVFLISCFRD